MQTNQDTAAGESYLLILVVGFSVLAALSYAAPKFLALF